MPHLIHSTLTYSIPSTLPKEELYHHLVTTHGDAEWMLDEASPDPVTGIQQYELTFYDIPRTVCDLIIDNLFHPLTFVSVTK